MSTNLNLPRNSYKELIFNPFTFTEKKENNANQDRIIDYFDQNLIQYLANLQKNMLDLTIKVEECTSSQEKIFSQLKMVFDKLQEFDSAEVTEEENPEEKEEEEALDDEDLEDEIVEDVEKKDLKENLKEEVLEEEETVEEEDLDEEFEEEKKEENENLEEEELDDEIDDL